MNTGGSDAESPVYRIVELTVTKVFKGSVRSGQKVQIKQLGGKLDGVEYRAADTTIQYLKPGQTYLLFLETYKDAPASLLNPQQAHNDIGASGAPTSLPGNSIQVSNADLARLAGAR